MTTIAAASRSMRRPLRASHTANPGRRVPAIISAATTTSHDRPAVTRSAVMTCGAMAGSVTCAQQVAARRCPRSRATRKYTLGMLATAALVESTIGKNGRHEDQEDGRRIADAEPEDRERDPRERRQAAEEVDQSAATPRAGARRVADQQAGRHPDERPPAGTRRTTRNSDAIASLTRRPLRSSLTSPRATSSGCGKSDSGKSCSDATSAQTATITRAGQATRRE